jgi:drug/metabolite transporter superfamily protein YnfA
VTLNLLAFGGISIAAPLGRLWIVEGQRPTAPNTLGALLAITGALVIVGAAAKRLS